MDVRRESEIGRACRPVSGTTMKCEKRFTVDVSTAFNGSVAAAVAAVAIEAVAASSAAVVACMSHSQALYFTVI
jgi:hypothetical protein